MSFDIEYLRPEACKAEGGNWKTDLSREIAY